jgi:membrane-bound ClpP family serine protease
MMKHEDKYTHLGAAGAGVAAGNEVGKARSKKSELLDAAALKVAQDMAREMGYDPTTGQKIAEETAEISENEVAERALQMLKEAGYLPQE